MRWADLWWLLGPLLLSSPPALAGDSTVHGDYFVATNGSDGNPGTLAAPFATLARAQQAMQGSSIKATYLRAGTYTLTANIAFTGSDNGETWQNYPGEAPVIDVTTNTNQTNITQDVLNDVPHGYSFQSVIQFSPMARNEPLMGATAGMTGNSGGSLPGSNGNGQSVGFSVGGGSDSENQYLVEGQDTENISGGASGANVPFQFIQEVQVKSSGIEAEHGGALGGVVNVVMKKGQNVYHGSFFATYEGDSLNGSQNATLRYDPLGAPFVSSGAPAGSPSSRSSRPGVLPANRPRTPHHPRPSG